MPRRLQPQRAKTSILWGLAAFLSLQAGLSAAVEAWLPQLRDPEYAYRARALRSRIAAARSHPPVVLFLGSSRTVVGVKAGELQEEIEHGLHGEVLVFNFGLTGAGPLTQLLSLKRLLAEGVHPSLILVEVLPPFLAGQPPVQNVELCRLPATRLSRQDLGLLNDYGLCSHALKRSWWEACVAPWYERRLAILSRVMPSGLPQQLRLDSDRRMDGSGWIAQSGPPSPEVYLWAVEHVRKEYALYFAGFRVGNPSSRAVREILELCRNEHIATGLLLMPEGGPFRSWYTADMLSQLWSFLDQLNREYHAPVIDAREWVPDHYFFDAHHLAAPGAAELTRRLAQDAKFQGLVRTQLASRLASVKR